MYSSRTYNAECVNVEGRRSLKVSDGSMFIYNGGEEYVDIWGAFDWEKVPGITSEVDSIPFICTSTSNTNILIKDSPITFAGTTSDGTYGVSGYAYLPPPSPKYNSTLTFKKSWFYFDDEIVVLTADINTNSSYDVVTTLDQRRVNGPIYTSESSSALADGLHDLSGEWWVHHDSVGYILPQVKRGAAFTQLFVENVNKTGNWQNINNIVTQVDTNELFTIWVQGQSPNAKRDSHEVIVVPAVSFVDFPSKRDAALVNIEVLFNSEDVQAVRHKALNIISSTFYKPGKLSTDQLSLTVNIPCIVMVVFTSAGIKLHVSDPTQSAAKITLTVQDDLICAGCTSQNDQTSVTVDLPRGDIKGSSISVFMQKPVTPTEQPISSPTTSGSAVISSALGILAVLLI
jgi:chondroitin AC lyase